jgi:hypothetical protein
MFRRLSEISSTDSSTDFRSRILPVRLANIEELQFYLRRLFLRRIEEREDEQVKEDNSNPNFMLEKDMNFRLYPFYINWKKVEANESGYYRIFVHFGYFGVSVYSSFKEKYPSLDVNNILYVLASFVSEYLLSKDNKSESSQKLIKEYFEKMPKLENLCELIQKKIIMLKEVPLILLVLKIYEIHFMLQKLNEDVEKVLKNEYLLGTYLDENEFKNIYQTHFKGKISKSFKKVVETNGKDYELPKTKAKFLNHIKSIYKKFKQN